MQRLIVTALLVVCATSPAWAWSNHALANYRAFEVMPEVAQAPAVPAESLEAFLAAQVQPIAQLLVDQDAWAQKHIAHYPPCPRRCALMPPWRNKAPRRCAGRF